MGDMMPGMTLVNANSPSPTHAVPSHPCWLLASAAPPPLPLVGTQTLPLPQTLPSTLFGALLQLCAASSPLSLAGAQHLTLALTLPPALFGALLQFSAASPGAMQYSYSSSSYSSAGPGTSYQATTTSRQGPGGVSGTDSGQGYGAACLELAQ